MYVIYFPLAAQSTDSPQWVAHSIAFRVTQHYNSQALLHTHSSRALASSHTVDSPSSAGVINDFLWLLSNSPSIVDPLFPIEGPPPPPPQPCASSVPPLQKRDRWTKISEGQEVREKESSFHCTTSFSKVQGLGIQDTLLSYVHQPRFKLPAAL